MKPEVLLKHFDYISDAPDAIPRLRHFILELAVRGKLVDQDPREAPASELLKGIQVERLRLEKAGEIRRQGPQLPIAEGDKPFKLPESWTWIRVGDGFNYDAGTKREPKELLPDRWLLELEDIEKDTSKVLTRLKVSDRRSLSTKSEFRAGDVLYGKLRPYLNKVIVATDCGYSTTEIVAIRSFLPLCSAYCALAFRRPDFVDYVTRLGRGTKMPRLRTPDAVVAVFPLPPVAEQYRIVTKVDDLMAMCDRLEEAHAQRETRRRLMTVASLQCVNQPLDENAPEVFRANARFYLHHLSYLTVSVEQIRLLRETILNLAVRGQLLLQDSKDEPASDLLRRIQAKQPRLIVNGALSRQKASTANDAIDLTFPLPCNWEAVNFGSVCNLVTSGSRGWAEYYAKSGPKFIRAQNIRFGKLRLDDLACVSLPQKAEGTRTQVSSGDLLIVITGAGVTNPAMLEEDLGEAYVSQHVALIKPADMNLSRWLLLCLMAPSGARAKLVERAYGAGKPGLNLDNIRSLPIPIPPLAEQHRIVAKVDELMALCGRLEEQLTAAQAEKGRFAEAVLNQALTDDDLPLDEAKGSGGEVHANLGLSR